MTDTTRRIPLWIIGTEIGITVISLIGIFFMVLIWDWDHPYNNNKRMN